MNLQGKTVLITGANGLVGMPTVKKCLEQGVNKVIAVDIKTDNLQTIQDSRLEINTVDLTYLHQCEQLFKDNKINVVLHLAGIKGSPSRTAKFPADYLFPMMMFNTNVIKASFDADVDWLVYMSSVGVYSPADIMFEDSVWSTMPSKNDWHPGWSKRMGELALDALKIQHNWTKWTVIRPSNIYGHYDNFAETATVIAANIWKIYNTTNKKIVCWGDGSAKRDFVFGNDVAEGTIKAVLQEVNDVVNFGCGQAVSIKNTIEHIRECFRELNNIEIELEWDTSKPNGDLLRCLSADKQLHYGLLPTTSLYQGILSTMKHYSKLNGK